VKEEILNRATEMFLNLGFKSVTMDDLAKRMSISKKTIYSHFCNKTKLVEESTMHLFNVITDGIDEIVAQEKNPIEELYEIKKLVMGHLNDEKASPQFQLQKYYPKVHRCLKTMQFDKMHGCVLKNVQRGVEMGLYRPNLDAEFVARIYFAGVNNIKDSEYFSTGEFSQAVLMDNFLEYHLRGIVTPEGRQKLNSIINSNQE
jgi:AcrR family transcriptional regulator